MVAMIIARSQTPLQITACGFIPINLELFTKVSNITATLSSSSSKIVFLNIAGGQALLHGSCRTERSDIEVLYIINGKIECLYILNCSHPHLK